MPYDNLYNRKIGAENNRTDQLHIDNLKRDDLYFAHIPQTSASAAKYITNDHYSKKPPMSGSAKGSFEDTGYGRVDGVAPVIKGGFGIPDILDHVPNVFKTTPGVVPALVEPKIESLLGLGKKKSKKKGGNLLDTIDKIMPFLGKGSLKKTKTMGVSGSDALGMVGLGKEKKARGRPKKKSVGSGFVSDAVDCMLFARANNKKKKAKGGNLVSDALGMVGLGEKKAKKGRGRPKKGGNLVSDALGMVGLGSEKKE